MSNFLNLSLVKKIILLGEYLLINQSLKLTIRSAENFFWPFHTSIHFESQAVAQFKKKKH